MTCRRAQELMESHIVGDLAPELAEQLDAHLRQCDACQRRYEEQKRLIALLKRVFGTKRRFA
jgi:anti-sigma factor RsiW